MQEEQLLFESAEKDSLLDFRKSEAGFLYAYVKKTKANSPLPVKGDLVQFQYEIEDLDQNIMYEKDSLGIIEYSIDEEELLPAIV